MPTYFVCAPAQSVSTKDKQEIARSITHIHSAATGAQGFFAQVIFQETAPGNHFMGGAPVTSNGVFVYGHIRAGRTPEQKKRLLRGIVDAIATTMKIEQRHIWAYLNELPHFQMVEYGHLLPEPGGEADWLLSLPAEDQNYLRTIGD
jgi:phenylpyruvate tautomerase PptA (4-oxalocrotonate tautomerase family)